MNKQNLFWIGVFLIFVGGMFSSQIISVILVEFAGARLQTDIENSDDIVDIPKPQELYYIGIIIQLLYGLIFLIPGVIIVRKYRK